jgi:hypothetical protein
MPRRRCLLVRSCVIAALSWSLGVHGAAVGAQQRRPLTPKTGNPTPGVAQPEPPTLADRVALSGCVRLSSQGAPPNVGTTPTDSRFVLDSVKKDAQVPAGTGTSDAATAPAAERYRLEAIESLLSPFVGARVEISGEVKTPLAGQAPVLLVETVRRSAGKCS